MNDPIEMRILNAVRGILAGRINDILQLSSINVPVIEFSDYNCHYGITPVLSLTTCECSEKERLLRLDAYSLTITFSLPESDDSELYCYAYSGAAGRAFYDDPALGGVVDRAVISGKKYVSPKKANCGDGWELVISLRITIEGEE